VSSRNRKKKSASSGRGSRGENRWKALMTSRAVQRKWEASHSHKVDCRVRLQRAGHRGQ
jgi:hypothetical protein